jgi:hypothetical protein
VVRAGPATLPKTKVATSMVSTLIFFATELHNRCITGKLARQFNRLAASSIATCYRIATISVIWAPARGYAGPLGLRARQPHLTAAVPCLRIGRFACGVRTRGLS